MSTPLFIVNIIKKTFPGRFLLARLTHFKPVGDAIDKLFFENDDIIILPRDKTIKVGAKLDADSSVALPSQIVDRFIEKANYHWIMNACICRDATACKDYPIGLGCLFLGEAAMGINPKLGRAVTKAEARDHVRKCREAGLVHLVGRNKLDSVWLNVKPANKLLTICNCCPCCCIWTMLPKLDRAIGAKITKMPGVHIRVNDNCGGCGECAQKCFAGAISISGNRAVITEDCRGCSRCVSVCPRGAIEIEIDNIDYVTESVARLSNLVDLD